MTESSLANRLCLCLALEDIARRKVLVDAAESLEVDPNAARATLANRRSNLEAVCSLIRLSAVLTDLDLHGNSLGTEGGAAIAKALIANGVLTDLNLSSNLIGGHYELGYDSDDYDSDVGYEGAEQYYCFVPEASGIAALAQVLKVNASLTNLSLRSNMIDSEGAKALAPALAANASLTSLDVRWNKLGDDGKAALQRAVKGREGFDLQC